MYLHVTDFFNLKYLQSSAVKSILVDRRIVLKYNVKLLHRWLRGSILHQEGPSGKRFVSAGRSVSPVICGTSCGSPARALG